jgi:hypothetical protein
MLEYFAPPSSQSETLKKRSQPPNWLYPNRPKQSHTSKEPKIGSWDRLLGTGWRRGGAQIGRKSRIGQKRRRQRRWHGGPSLPLRRPASSVGCFSVLTFAFRGEGKYILCRPHQKLIWVWAGPSCDMGRIIGKWAAQMQQASSNTPNFQVVPL